MRRMRFPGSVRCSMTTREAASASRFRSLRQPGRQLSTWNEALIACSKRQSERHEAGLDRNSSGALLQGLGTTCYSGAGLLELGEVGGNLALPLGQDLLEFGHGQFFLFQKEQDAQAIRVGRQPQGFQD